MYCYQCAECSQERLRTVHYTTPLNDNSRCDINTAAGGTQDTECTPVKPIQLPEIHTIFSCRYSIYIDDCDSSVKADLKCDKNIKSSINGSPAEGSSLVGLLKSQDNLSTPQHDDNNNIAVHGSRHAREEYDVCITCRKPFSKQAVAHNRIHTGEKPSSCNVREKSLSKQVTDTKHSRTHKREKEYPCSKCSESFTTKGNLSAHNRLTHEGEMRFSCITCGKLFSQKRRLLLHRRIHTGEKSFTCTTCAMVFTTHAHLVRHTRIHTGEKPYCCETCGQSFRYKPTLIRHIRTHTCSCETCGESFNHKSTLTRHIRVHTGEKPCLCTICDKLFAHRSSLIQHIKRQHKQLQ